MNAGDAQEVLTMFTLEEALQVGPDEANRRSKIAIANLLDQLYLYWPNSVDAWVSGKWPERFA